MAEDGYPVKLHIYDLSQGMARQLSATILGKAIEAIWHTGVVVYGREYYFGGGIQQGQPGRTPYGTPVRVETLGVTHHPKEVFEEFLRKISPRYTLANYNLLSNNCNNFSNEVVQFLTGASVPSYILELPNEVMNSPVGALILPMIQGLETSLRAGAVPQPPQFRPAPAPVAVATTVRQPSVKEKSAAVDKPEGGGKTAVNSNGDGSTVAPPAVQPAAPPAAAAQTQLSANDVEARSSAADKPEEDGKTAFNSNGDGSTVAPPAAAPAAAAQTQMSVNDVEARSSAADKPEEAGKTAIGGSTVGPPAAPPAAAAQVSTALAAVATKAAPPDPLAEAKSRVQEEIKREFAAIMASGTARAGEAAALAVRRVMERHGLQRAAAAVAPQG